MDEPFCHEAIITVIRETFFAMRKKVFTFTPLEYASSILNSDLEASNKLELPAAMVAIAATAACLPAFLHGP
jgi:Domain of unknown function (DUF6532)